MKKICLDNKVTILTQSTGLLPVVALQVWVDFGSADEPVEWAGVAHVIEHMLFKGAEGRPGQELAKKVEAWGGNVNAWTSFDETVYHLVLPTRHFGRAVDLLAQTVLHPAFDQSELDREKLVILEEIHQGKDQPTHLCSESLFATVFRRHPYGRPIIGFDETVRKIDSKVLRKIHAKHYRGPNLTVVATGAIDETKAAKALSLAFAEAPKGRRTTHRPTEPLQKRPRKIANPAPVEESTFMLGFPIPGFGHEDMAALSVLSGLLGEGESSRLNLALRRREPLCSDIYSYAYSPKDQGLFVVGGAARPNLVPTAVDRAAQVIEEITTKPVSSEELDKVRGMIRADTLFRSETVQGEARKLGYYQLMTDDPDYEEKYLDRLERLTPMAVLDVSRRYLTVSSTTLALVHPESASPAAKSLAGRLLDIAKPHLAAKKAGHRPMRKERSGIYRTKLSNGLTLLVLPDPSTPVVALRAMWFGGLLAEPPSRNGLSTLTAELLTRGTRQRPADAVVTQMEALGGSIASSSGRNTLSLQAEFPSRHWDEATDIFLDSLLEAGFDETEFELAQKALIGDLVARQDNPAAVAFDLFRKSLFGAKHPYGRPLPGRVETVSKLTVAQVRRFHRSLLQPRRMVLAAAGDVDPEAFAVMVEQRLSFEGRGESFKLPAPPSFPRRPKEAFFPMKRQQAHLIVGYPGLQIEDEDRFAMRILSDVLGGQSGRLFVHLRDQQGLAYHVGFYTLLGLAPGYAAAYMATDPTRIDEALEGLKRELAAIRDNPPSARAIRQAKTHIAGSHVISRQTRHSLASSMAIDELYGLGHDAFLRYPKRIEAVTEAQVAACAARLIDESREVVVMVSPSRTGGQEQ